MKRIVCSLLVGMAMAAQPVPAIAGNSGKDPAQAIAILQLVYIESQFNKAYKAGEMAQALQWARQCYTTAEQAHLDNGRMFCAGYVADAAEGTGDFSLSREARLIQKELAVRFSNDAQLWSALNGLGTIAWRKKLYLDALTWYDQAYDLSLKWKDETGANSIRFNRANVYADMGEKDKALGEYKACLKFARKLKDKYDEGLDLSAIGMLLSDKGRPAEALRYHSQALDIFRGLGKKDNEAMVLLNIGVALEQLGKYEEALTYDKQALRLYQEIGDRHGEYLISKNIAIHLRKLGRFKEAAEYQAHADFLSRQGGY
ncbi:MAG: tetratricopeptide repeat protein [Gammaproteobacteria bacterium]|nr:MAG: tetratricopeptide repeat protein [Gammaproteobacteria bacterium]